MQNKELQDWYLSPDDDCMIKSRMIRWEEHVAHMGGKPEGKRPRY
jgi:hypothetical protein